MAFHHRTLTDMRLVAPGLEDVGSASTSIQFRRSIDMKGSVTYHLNAGVANGNFQEETSSTFMLVSVQNPLRVISAGLNSCQEILTSMKMAAMSLSIARYASKSSLALRFLSMSLSAMELNHWSTPSPIWIMLRDSARNYKINLKEMSL